MKRKVARGIVRNSIQTKSLKLDTKSNIASTLTKKKEVMSN